LNYPFEIELFVIGVAAGVLGTLVGLGGGFVVIPILRIVFDVSPAVTAGASLVMVLANGVSGSLAYVRQGRADVKLALLVSITGIPACIAGALAVRYVSFASFDIVYAIMLIAFFIDIMRRRNKPAATSRPRLPGLSERVLVDASGQEFRYAWNTPIVLLSGLAIGFIASFFGIGGGIVFLIVFIAVHVAARDFVDLAGRRCSALVRGQRPSRFGGAARARRPARRPIRPTHRPALVFPAIADGLGLRGAGNGANADRPPRSPSVAGC
jgi:uncharacterized membrane protein YfcA